MIRSFLYAEHFRSIPHVAVLNSPQGGSLRTDVRKGLLKEISDHGVGVFYVDICISDLLPDPLC